MLNLMLKMNPRFTQEDRKACEPVIARMLELANIARLEGILAVDEAVENEPDAFLKESIIAVVDDNKPERVYKFMSYMIVSSDATGAALLRKFIIAEGVLEIQKGINPRLIQDMLGAMLGGGYLERLRAKEKAERDDIPTLSEFYNLIKHRANEPNQLEEKLIAMPDELLGASLDKVDNRDLSVAFNGYANGTIHKMMDNLPLDRQREVIRVWKSIGYINIINVEGAIENIFRTLGIMGAL